MNAYLIDPVTLRRFVSRDDWNKPTYTNVALMGRVEWQTKLVRDFKGEEVISAALVYLDNTVSSVTNMDRIILDGVDHAILRIDKRTDFSISHWEIWVA